jgi:hypothetical protein
LAQIITLYSAFERHTPAGSQGESIAPVGDSSLRYAFLTLLALNVFVVSGVVCFAILYFAR